jgi:hypothetical protein
LAWRWLRFQNKTALVSGTDDRRQARIAQSHDRRIGTQTVDRLWRYVTIGKVPTGAVLRSAT